MVEAFCLNRAGRKRSYFLDDDSQELQHDGNRLKNTHYARSKIGCFFSVNLFYFDTSTA